MVVFFANFLTGNCDIKYLNGVGTSCAYAVYLGLSRASLGA